MNWIQKGDMHFSAPYRVIKTVRGFDVWLYSKEKSGRIAQDVPSITQAKQIAEAYDAKQHAFSGEANG